MGEVLKRRHIRALPDLKDLAFIDFNLEHDDKSFEADLSAYIVNESPMGGSSLALRKDDRIILNMQLLAKVGKLSPLRAEVVWIKELDEELLRVGLKFLE